MDRNQAKKFLPVIQAYVEGKQIQHLYNEWKDIDVFDIDLAVNPELYRIKPESKYRSFANAEECWTEMLKHQPFGWYKDKDGDFFMVSAVSNQGLRSLQAMFEDGYTFVDGFPFGVKVEE